MEKVQNSSQNYQLLLHTIQQIYIHTVSKLTQVYQEQNTPTHQNTQEGSRFSTFTTGKARILVPSTSPWFRKEHSLLILLGLTPDGTGVKKIGKDVKSTGEKLTSVSLTGDKVTSDKMPSVRNIGKGGNDEGKEGEKWWTTTSGRGENRDTNTLGKKFYWRDLNYKREEGKEPKKDKEQSLQEGKEVAEISQEWTAQKGGVSKPLQTPTQQNQQQQSQQQ